MTKERQIEILSMNGCTEAEAKKHLDNGSVVLTDFEERFDDYMKEWDIEGEDIPIYKKMIDEKKPAPDWGIVEDDGHTFYIMYML